MDQLSLILKILSTFVTKQTASTRRSTVLSLSIQLVFSGVDLIKLFGCKFTNSILQARSFHTNGANIADVYKNGLAYKKV
jgi:hypothetical protein